MEILYLLVPLSVVLVFAIGVAFWWSLKSGQFDDLEGPAYRILMDDDRPSADKTKASDVSSPSVEPPGEARTGDAVTNGKKNTPV